MEAASALDWTEPADPQGERPELWAGTTSPVVTFRIDRHPLSPLGALLGPDGRIRRTLGLARRAALGPDRRLGPRGHRGAALHRRRLPLGRRHPAVRYRPGPLREISAQRSLPARGPLRHTPREQPDPCWWPTCSTRPRRATWRPARPAPYGSRSRSRAMPPPATTPPRWRSKARGFPKARTLAPRHRPHAARPGGVELPPRPVAAPGGRGTRRGRPGLERRPLREDAPDDASAGRRRTEGHHRHALKTARGTTAGAPPPAGWGGGAPPGGAGGGGSTVFDRWVEFMLGLGIGKYINCYSMLPWNNMLHYRDAATGQYVDVKADPGTPAFREMGACSCPPSRHTCAGRDGSRSPTSPWTSARPR